MHSGNTWAVETQPVVPTVHLTHFLLCEFLTSMRYRDGDFYLILLRVIVYYHILYVKDYMNGLNTNHN